MDASLDAPGRVRNEILKRPAVGISEAAECLETGRSILLEGEFRRFLSEKFVNKLEKSLIVPKTELNTKTGANGKSVEEISNGMMELLEEAGSLQEKSMSLLSATAELGLALYQCSTEHIIMNAASKSKDKKELFEKILTSLSRRSGGSQKRKFGDILGDSDSTTPPESQENSLNKREKKRKKKEQNSIH